MKPITEKVFTRVLKAKCLDCCGGSKQEMENCSIFECPLHSYLTVVRAPRKKDKRKGSDSSEAQG